MKKTPPAPVNERTCAWCSARYVGHRPLCPRCLARMDRFTVARVALEAELPDPEAAA